MRKILILILILILVFIIFAFVSSAFANFADEYAIKKKDGKYGLLSKTTQTLILCHMSTIKLNTLKLIAM